MVRIFVYTFLCLLILSCGQDGGLGSSGDSSVGTGGSMARFAAKGDYLYVVNDDFLKTFDISTAEHPRYLNEKDKRLEFAAETIFPTDSLLFIGSMSGMSIISIKRPDFPQWISTINHITSCDPVVVSGNYAYVTLYSGENMCRRMSNELNIYDISDISKPVLVHTERDFMQPKGLGIDGNRLFICDKGLKVYDISNPVKPEWIGDVSHIAQMRNVQTYDVIPLDGTLLLIGSSGFYQLDYSGEKLSLVSSIPVSNN